MSFLSKIFGTYSEREVKKLQTVVDKIMDMDEAMTKLTDDELKAKTVEFRQRFENGESLDHILPEAFAVCREASWRVLGMKHYREQLVGGMVLHQGRIAEMKTGEGKTLVATLPTYLNGLTGRGVHVITVNDYLAKRDMEWMGQLYQFLGLTTGVIVHGLTSEQRRANYGADITYGTNNEFGFDYLRDNMVIYKEERVQRELVFAVVDEVDSILVDEARTPLIISGAGEKSTKFYNVADNFVKQLRDEDYTIDEKANAVMLAEAGMERAEKFFNIDNYADADHLELQHYITQALKANYGMKIDKDYMVKDGQVIIVDEFTGRLMEGRRYSDGLHQAIEAKEGVKIERESKTLATITFQNYFRMYEKLSGMTGTALTEENEFREIYALDVIVVPTHREIARIDRTDAVFKNRAGKYKAIIEEIKESHEKGQPVLVGTVSIEQSEYLSALLKKSGIKNHQILNAKYHEQEAEIISHAGELGMITIATNMAGRGTDIKLGEGVLEVGGLKIIGTERHESRRIDNQLRGRAGRQGDPGESVFFISLEDDLMRIFGSERYEGLFDKIGLDDENIAEDGKGTAKILTKAIEGAQRKVEGHNFEIRKNLIGYDDVMNMQREVIYRQRTEVLEGKNLKEQVETMINEIIDESVISHLSNVDQDYEGEVKKLIQYLEGICLPHGLITVEQIVDMDINDVKAKILNVVTETYNGKELEFGEEQLREIERVVLLRVVDQKWMAHIDNMDHLKQGIGLRAYKQQDPTQAYQIEGSAMFEEMIEGIKVETIKFLFHIQPEKPVERERVVEETTASHGGSDDKSSKKEPVKSEKVAGRNDQCPCGSGKKYKNCCGRE